MTNKLLSLAFRQLIQMCKGAEQMSCTSLRFDHVEQYGLYQNHSIWVRQVFIAASGYLGALDVSKFANLLSDTIEKPNPYCLSGHVHRMYMTFQRRKIRASSFLQDKEDSVSNSITYIKLLLEPTGNF